LGRRTPRKAARKVTQGDLDLGGVLVAMRCCGPDVFQLKRRLHRQRRFTQRDRQRSLVFGQAVRRELTKRWTLIGETCALPPQGRETSSTLHFSDGAQFRKVLVADFWHNLTQL